MAPGTVTGFLGPNGAGKTTTLRVLLGLVAPTAGEATIDGRPYRALGDPLRKVGAVIEGASFHPGRSARNHLRLAAHAAKLDPARIDPMLALVGLSEVAGKRVEGYSLGMKQRLGLAESLLGDPEVLILDEPANGLDPQGIRWLRTLLRNLANEGRTVLVSSHILAEVAQSVDRVVVIGRGRLVADSTLEELMTRSAGGVRVQSPDAARLDVLLRGRGLEPAAVGDGRLVVTGITTEDVGRLCHQEGIMLFELTAQAHSLEDVFLELTQEAGLTE